MTPEETIAKAERCARLINDPDLLDAYAVVRQAIFNQIEQCPVRDTEALVKLRLMLKLLNDVRANLEQAVAEGKAEVFQLEEKRRFKLFR